MDGDRFFQSTRGKIVASLKRRRAASAVDLADELGITPNAVRQQLLQLERDGLIEERSVRRGPTKPTFEFSLTEKAETLFPQRYDVMLEKVLDIVRERGGDAAVQDIFDTIAERTVGRVSAKLGSAAPRARLAGVVDMLQHNGAQAELDLVDGRFILREHHCPYAKTVTTHPEVCSMIHKVIDGVVGGEHRQVESLATGGSECRFELNVPDHR